MPSPEELPTDKVVGRQVLDFTLVIPQPILPAPAALPVPLNNCSLELSVTFHDYLSPYLLVDVRPVHSQEVLLVESHPVGLVNEPTVDAQAQEVVGGSWADAVVDELAVGAS